MSNIYTIKFYAVICTLIIASFIAGLVIGRKFRKNKT